MIGPLPDWGTHPWRLLREQEENATRSIGHRIASLAATAALITAVPAGAQEWLSLGAKGWAPTVFRRSGTGSANAVAEARVTPQALTGWCENWTPDDKGCPARMMAEVDMKRVYRATADCLAGRITTVQGESYTLAGVWDASDVGAGRTKWRDASGRIVGRDNASDGLGISQQWEVLCPGPLNLNPAVAGP